MSGSTVSKAALKSRRVSRVENLYECGLDTVVFAVGRLELWPGDGSIVLYFCF